jgi:hypothetical protein
MIVPLLAMAGSLARKKVTPALGGRGHGLRHLLLLWQWWC